MYLENQLEKLASESFEKGIDEKGVLEFAKKMLFVLSQAREKDKRGWYHCDNGGLFVQLKNEIKELEKALSNLCPPKTLETIDYEDNIPMTSGIKNELIDIANFCMMLYFNGEIT